MTSHNLHSKYFLPMIPLDFKRGVFSSLACLLKPTLFWQRLPFPGGALWLPYCSILPQNGKPEIPLTLDLYITVTCHCVKLRMFDYLWPAEIVISDSSAHWLRFRFPFLFHLLTLRVETCLGSNIQKSLSNLSWHPSTKSSPHKPFLCWGFRKSTSFSHSNKFTIWGHWACGRNCPLCVLCARHGGQGDQRGTQGQPPSVS